MNHREKRLIQQGLNQNSVNHSVITISSRSVKHEYTSITIDNARGVVVFQHKDKIVELDILNAIVMGIKLRRINGVVRQ